MFAEYCKHEHWHYGIGLHTPVELAYDVAETVVGYFPNATAEATPRRREPIIRSASRTASAAVNSEAGSAPGAI